MLLFYISDWFQYPSI